MIEAQSTIFRNSVRALITKDDKLLVAKYRDDEGFWYLTPGGGQEPHETFVDALKRECLEEISSEVIVNDLKFVREYFGKHALFDSDIHQIEYFFECDLTDKNYKCEKGKCPDIDQIETVWLEIEKLEEYRLYPLTLRSILKKRQEYNGPIYLGHVD